MILLALSISLGITRETAVLAVVFIAIRRHSSAFHLKNGWLCLALGLLTFIAPALALKNVHISIITAIAVFIPVCAAFYLYAPTPTKNRPISRSKAKISKRRALANACILLVIAVCFVELRAIIISGLAICALSILPITYKLFKNETCGYPENGNPIAATQDLKTSGTLTEMLCKVKASCKSLPSNRFAHIYSFVIVFSVTVLPELTKLIQVECVPPSWFEEPEIPECLKDRLK